MPEDLTNNHALAAGLERAIRRLQAFTEAGLAVRKISLIGREPAFMMADDEDDHAPPSRPRR